MKNHGNVSEFRINYLDFCSDYNTCHPKVNCTSVFFIIIVFATLILLNLLKSSCLNARDGETFFVIDLNGSWSSWKTFHRLVNGCGGELHFDVARQNLFFIRYYVAVSQRLPCSHAITIEWKKVSCLLSLWPQVCFLCKKFCSCGRPAVALAFVCERDNSQTSRNF